MKLKQTLSALIAAVGLTVASASHAVIYSDIVMMVDESGSMGTVQANLRNNISNFASILQAGGLDVRFALVGYGSSNQYLPRTMNTVVSTKYNTNITATAAETMFGRTGLFRGVDMLSHLFLGSVGSAARAWFLGSPTRE